MSKEPTIHQHYIPVMILKRHASAKGKRSRDSKVRVSSINKEEFIDKVGFQNWLYEVDNMKINYLENVLGLLETRSNDIFDKLSKAETLSNEEKIALNAFAAILLLRHPEQIELSTEFVRRVQKDKSIENNTNEYGTAKLLSLDITHGENASESALFSIVRNWLSDYNLYCFETDDVLMISDKCPIAGVFPCKPFLSNLVFPYFIKYYLSMPIILNALIFPYDAKHYLMWTKGEFPTFYNKADESMAQLTNHIVSSMGGIFYSSIPYNQIKGAIKGVNDYE